MSDLSSFVSDLSKKPLSQWSPVDKAMNTLVTAMAHPQANTDDFQRATEPRVIRALVKSIGNDQIGFGSSRISLDNFNDRIHVRQIEKKTSGDTGPLNTSDVAKVFGVSIEALTIAHTLQAERRTIADEVRRVDKSGENPVKVKAVTKALTAMDDSLHQAESAFGTLVHNQTIGRKDAQDVLWFAGQAQADMELGGAPFARGQALIGALATHARMKQAGLVAEAKGQRALLRTDPQAKGRLFAINSTIGSFEIAAPALRDASARAAEGASAYLTATRETTALKFVSGSVRQQGKPAPGADPRSIGERGGTRVENRLGL